MMDTRSGQSTIEFAFAMIVVLFLIYGMVRVFGWVGMDVAQRTWQQQNSVSSDYNMEGNNANTIQELPEKQLGGYGIDQMRHMAAVYNGSLSQ